MGDGGEVGFEGVRCKVYVIVQYQVEEVFEVFDVVGYYVFEGDDGVGVVEVQVEYVVCLGGDEGDVGGICVLLQVVEYVCGVGGQFVVEIGVVDQVQGGQVGGYCQWVV